MISQNLESSFSYNFWGDKLLVFISAFPTSKTFPRYSILTKRLTKLKLMCGSHGFSSDVRMRNFVHGDLFHYFLMI